MWTTTQALIVFLTTLAQPALALTPKGFTSLGEHVLAPPVDRGLLGYGATVALNAETGNRLAIGNPTGDGAIYIYDYDGSDWGRVRFFRGRTGEGIGKYFALSEDGSRIAIRGTAGGKDAVRLFDIDTGSRIGTILTCNDPGQRVSISADGRVIAMSCEEYDTRRGMVKFFYLDDNENWISLNTLEGTRSGDLFGFDTSLTTFGTRVAISAPGSDGEDGLLADRGSVGVYDHNSAMNKWELVGSELEGQYTRDQFGHSVALGAGGRTFVASSPGIGIAPYASTIKAFVAFQGLWLPIGGELSSATETFNGPVSIDDNGTRIAVSSSSPPRSDSPTNRIRVFDLNSGMWEQHGDTISWPSDMSDPGRTGLSLGDNGVRLAYASTEEDSVRVLKCSPGPLKTEDGDSPAADSVITGRLGGDDWNIDVVDISVAFNDAESKEIRAIYEFRNTREASYSIMGLDCEEHVDEIFIASAETLQPASTEGKNRLKLDFDVNHTSIVNSPFYTQLSNQKAMLALCLRVDLLNDKKRPVVSEKNRLYIEIDTAQRFALSDLNAEAGTSIDFQLQVSLDYKVKTCQCDTSLKCLKTPLTSRDDALICVETSDSSSVEVASIYGLTLKQGALTQTAIEGGSVVEPDFTAVEKIGNKFVIRMRLISSFFDSSDPEDILAVGVCLLRFKTAAPQTRFLSSFVMHRNAKDVTNDASTAFDVNFELLGADEDTSDASGMKPGLTFALFTGFLFLGLIF